MKESPGDATKKIFAHSAPPISSDDKIARHYLLGTTDEHVGDTILFSALDVQISMNAVPRQIFKDACRGEEFFVLFLHHKNFDFGG